MNRVDKLRASRSNYSVKLHEFLRISSKRPEAYIIFFEGKDEKYYSHRIELLRDDLVWVGIDSGGKDNVLKLYEIIKNYEDHRGKNTLYIVDRDFDEPGDLPNDRKVYITPGYSVENLYVNENLFRKVLRQEFGLDEHSDEDKSFERCVQAFNKCLGDFTDCIAELNGWVMLVRRHERSARGTARANFASIDVKKFVRVDLQTCSSNYKLSEIEQITLACKSFSQQDALSEVAAISIPDRLTRFRGKFQAYFLRKFLTKLCDDANSDMPVLFESKRRVSLHLSENNFLSELCQYADTPACLKNFINSIPVVDPSIA